MSRAKNKIIISFLVIAFVLLSVVATIAIVFALQQQNISTSLNISYTAVDIDGSVSATYKLGKNNTYGEATNLVPTADAEHISADGNSLVFYADDTNNAGTLEFPVNQIEFSSQQSSMLIEYTFTNNGDVHYIASLDLDTTINYQNMVIEYGIWDSTNEEIKYSTDRYAVVVPANSSNSYWIRISIDKLTSDASLNGNFDWLLDGCDEKEKSYLTITSVEIIGSNGSYKISFSGEGEYIAGEEVIFPDNISGTPVTSIVKNNSITQTQKNLVKSVFIPASVTAIGQSAFAYYEELEEVIFEQNELEANGNFDGTGLLIINDYVFRECKFDEIQIPNTVTKISFGVFYNCYRLTRINIPESVLSLGDTCFSGCSNLEKIIIPNGITHISEQTFYCCISLKEITITSNVTSIGKNAFSGCASLTNVTFENTENWFVADSTDATEWAPISSTDLIIPATAATYLTSTYANKFWSKQN